VANSRILITSRDDQLAVFATILQILPGRCRPRRGERRRCRARWSVRPSITVCAPDARARRRFSPCADKVRDRSRPHVELPRPAATDRGSGDLALRSQLHLGRSRSIVSSSDDVALHGATPSSSTTPTQSQHGHLESATDTGNTDGGSAPASMPVHGGRPRHRRGAIPAGPALCQGFTDQTLRASAADREVAAKVRVVHRHILSASGSLAIFELENAIDELEGVAMR